jgi:hypothetical protein
VATAVSGELHQNNWFRDWLIENDIKSSAEAYRAAKDRKLLTDLVSRAAAQQTKPIGALSGHGLVAGRSFDLSPYLACPHPDCLTGQVDRLFGRVWHYFDQIAIVGLDAHMFLESFAAGEATATDIAKSIAGNAQPILHIREIGADGLVTWITKPPPCATHWEEYETIPAYKLPKNLELAIASELLAEGTVELVERSDRPKSLILNHRDLENGSSGEEFDEISNLKRRGESLEMALARKIVRRYWINAATDTYAARSMGSPLGLGIRLEAKLARLQGNAISATDIAFNLNLPVVDGLPLKELLALRDAEQDTFAAFRDSLNRAFKERLATVEVAGVEADSIAREIQMDMVDPALHKIEQRLHAAQGVLRRKHIYNIGVAGLATVCGIFGEVPLASALGVAAVVGGIAAESKLTEEKRDIALEGMYFLWQAKNLHKGG